MLSLARGKEGQFKLVSGYKPEGDQPAAIDSLARNLSDGVTNQVLLGVTGSGKTFTMANVIAQLNRPALVIAPNKTLAAQLYNEFKSLFPENAVRYFVSYYDYYQPEAYVPSTDTFIEKDASINDEIDKLRHSATKALLERNDVLIVASVSCIYGLGEPEVYFEQVVFLEEQQHIDRDRVLRKLVDIPVPAQRLRFSSRDLSRARRYRRNFPRLRGKSRRPRRVLRRRGRGPLRDRSPARQNRSQAPEASAIYPASHYVTTSDRLDIAVTNIREELKERLEYISPGKSNFLRRSVSNSARIYDLELLAEMGVCPGIENYSRHLTGRAPGQAPPTLLEYFAQELPSASWTRATSRFRSLAGCIAAIARARRRWSISAFDSPPRSIIARSISRNGRGLLSSLVYVSATPGDYELPANPAVSWSSN